MESADMFTCHDNIGEFSMESVGPEGGPGGGVLDRIGTVSTAPGQSRDVFTDLAKVGTVLNS